MGASLATVELEATVNKLIKDQQILNSLLDAISSGQADTVQTLVSAAPGVVSVKQQGTGKLPLHEAAAAGNLSIMAMLVEAGASLEQKDGKDRTPLKVCRLSNSCFVHTVPDPQVIIERSQSDGKYTMKDSLQAARAAEQCDAEGWLIQQGPQDPDSKTELTEAASISTFDAAPPSAASLNGVHQ